MDAVVLVTLVRGQLESVKVDIPHEVLVLDYPEGIEGEPQLVLHRRQGGVYDNEDQLIEETVSRFRHERRDWYKSRRRG